MSTYDVDSLTLDEIHKAMGIPKSDKYFHVWIWFKARSSETVKDDWSWSATVKYILSKIKTAKNPTSWMQDYATDSLNVGNFKWVNKDERQLRVLKKLILGLIDGGRGCEWLRPILTIEGIEDESRIRLYCDFSSLDNPKRNIAWMALSNQWIEQRKQDEKFKWFLIGNNQQKRDELQGWIERNSKKDPKWNRPIKCHLDVLEFFDCIDDSDVEKIISNVKSNVYQKNHREKLTNKKQKNFLLSNSTIARLNKLQDKYGISHTRIIETLIRKESEKNLYISEEISLLRALDERNDD